MHYPYIRPKMMAQDHEDVPRVVRHGSLVSNRLREGDRLRGCQREALDSLVRWFQDGKTTDRTALVVMPTGSGKSGVIASLPYWFGEAVHKGELDIDLSKPILVIAPGLNILEQLKHSLKPEFGRDCFLMKVGAISGSDEVRKKLYLVKVMETTNDVPGLALCQEDIVLTNAQKWRRHVDARANTTVNWQDLDKTLFSLIVVDEAHHLPSPQWQRIIDYFQPYSKVVFFTATPFRTDGKEIAIVESYAYHLRDDVAVQQGLIRTVHFEALHFRGSDNREANYCDPLEYKPYTESVIKKVIQLIDRKDPLPGGTCHCAMLICRDTNDAENIVKPLCQRIGQGMRVECVHSKVKQHKLEKVMKEIKKEVIRIIIVVQMLLEGFDCPCVSVVGILTRIRSPVKFSQFIGRARRVIKGEDNVLADIITHEYFQQDELYRKFKDGHLIPLNDVEPDEQ